MSAQMKSDWRVIACVRCSGFGLVSVYSAGGSDFEGAGECPDCSQGSQYIRPSGHLFLYPGGPACGRGTREEYENATPSNTESALPNPTSPESDK